MEWDGECAMARDGMGGGIGVGGMEWSGNRGAIASVEWDGDRSGAAASSELGKSSCHFNGLSNLCMAENEIEVGVAEK